MKKWKVCIEDTSNPERAKRFRNRKRPVAPTLCGLIRSITLVNWKRDDEIGDDEFRCLECDRRHNAKP